MTVDQDPAVDDVEPLTEPTPTPWAGADDVAAPDPEPGDLDDTGPEPEALTDDELAGILRVVVEAPFDWAGAWFGSPARAPEPLVAPIRELWPLELDQSSRIARRLAAAIPTRWRGSRLLAHSPLALAGLELASAFQYRARHTAQLVREYEASIAAGGAEPAPAPETTTDDAPTGTAPAGTLRARSGAPRRPGRRADRAARPVSVDAAAGSAPRGPDGWAGAGLAPGPTSSG